MTQYKQLCKAVCTSLLTCPVWDIALGYTEDNVPFGCITLTINHVLKEISSIGMLEALSN